MPQPSKSNKEKQLLYRAARKDQKQKLEDAGSRLMNHYRMHKMRVYEKARKKHHDTEKDQLEVRDQFKRDGFKADKDVMIQLGWEKMHAGHDRIGKKHKAHHAMRQHWSALAHPAIDFASEAQSGKHGRVVKQDHDALNREINADTILRHQTPDEYDSKTWPSSLEEAPLGTDLGPNMYQNLKAPGGLDDDEALSGVPAVYGFTHLANAQLIPLSQRIG